MPAKESQPAEQCFLQRQVTSPKPYHKCHTACNNHVWVPDSSEQSRPQKACQWDRAKSYILLQQGSALTYSPSPTAHPPTSFCDRASCICAPGWSELAMQRRMILTHYSHFLNSDVAGAYHHDWCQGSDPGFCLLSKYSTELHP